MKKTIAFYTLGCKVNFAETSFLANSDNLNNFNKVNFSQIADIYVIHSCILTSAAEKKTRNSISKAHRTNPQADIIVMGCVSQLHANNLEKIPGVKYVLGNNSKFSLAEIIKKLDKNEVYSKVDDVHSNPEFHLSYSQNERTRSFLKVQDGCDCYCNYCIVPYARGKSRSASIKQVIDAVDNITNSGIKEIILTGINLGDFGKERSESLISLLQEISKNKELQRIRISSLEPQHFSNQLIEEICSNPKIMPHIHIPIQAGSDSILQKMGRSYTRNRIQEICYSLVNKMPEVCIAADVISGFPGETDDEFENSYDFYKDLPLAYLHVFTYSEREGTVAAKFSEKVNPKIKKIRTDRLLDLSKSKKTEFALKYRNTIHEILVETSSKNGYVFGFTQNYIKTSIVNNPELYNQIVKVKLIDYNEEEEFYSTEINT